MKIQKFLKTLKFSNPYKVLKIKSLRKKRRRKLNESNLYSHMNRQKSDELFREAMEIEDEIIKLMKK